MKTTEADDALAAGGFTLIELMVVVGIMILISAIVVSSSFGLSRASGYQAAENVVYNTLQLAHQKACTDGKLVIVAFVSDKEKYDDDSLTAIAAAGTVTCACGNDDEDDDTPPGGNGENFIRARCANLREYTAGGPRGIQEGSSGTVWNLTTGAKVKKYVTSISSQLYRTIPGSDSLLYYYSATKLEARELPGFKKEWNVGDQFGFQIVPVQVLPKGFKIGMGGASKSDSPAKSLIVFKPDGDSYLADEKMVQRGDGKAKIFLYEEMFEGDTARAVKIEVNNGVVSVAGK